METRLPGAATSFDQRATREHLEIGLDALDPLRDQVGSAHSRKPRSFDGPVVR